MISYIEIALKLHKYEMLNDMEFLSIIFYIIGNIPAPTDSQNLLSLIDVNFSYLSMFCCFVVLLCFIFVIYEILYVYL